MRSLLERNPYTHFRPLPDRPCSLAFDSQLYFLRVNFLEVRPVANGFRVNVNFTNTHSEAIAPKIWVSFWDDQGRLLARADIVNHVAVDVKPGQTTSTEDWVRLPEGQKATIVGVDDDRASRVAEWVEECNNRLEQEAAKAEEAVRGPRPRISAWDGVCQEVDDFLRRNLDDYPGLQYVAHAGPLPYGDDAWCVIVRFRARNAFGAYRLEQWVFVIRDRRVIRCFPMP